MRDASVSSLRDDCRASLAASSDLPDRLAGQRLAVIGGTGFVGSWLAEAAACLNDDLGGSLRIDLFGRSAGSMAERFPHLKRPDIAFHSIDVRSPFELPGDTTRVLFAAGINDPRIQASDPHRVFQTAIYGIDHALAAAARLERIERFVNISSGLVVGNGLPERPFTEDDLGMLDFARFHNLYAEARRAAESLVATYASQYRIPVSTARAFTFLGPYQALDAPWAVNNFVRDALSGHDIRIHGSGETRRSYLYGSDVATWLLTLLTKGRDGTVYNVGGREPVSHRQAAEWVATRSSGSPKLLYRSHARDGGRSHDFIPDVSHTERELGVTAVIDAPGAIGRLMGWHAERTGQVERGRILS